MRSQQHFNGPSRLIAAALVALAVHGGAALAQVGTGDPATESPPTATPPSSAWASAFTEKAKLSTMLRSSYFVRTKPNEVGPAAEAWGIGGWLAGESGEMAQMLSIGGAVYYVVPAYAPSDGGGNFVLTGGQDGYSTLGEAWARLRYGDHALTVGRQALSFGWSLDGIYRTYNRFDGSFIGRRDIRGMLPLDFEAATLTGRFLGGNLRYYSGWAWAMRQVNSADFEDLGTGAFLPEDSDGMAFVGAQWKINNDLMLQGSWHFVQNLADLAFVDLDYVYRMPEGRYLRFDTQYIYQSSNRDAPGTPPTVAKAVALKSTGSVSDIKTWNWAGYVEARPWPWLVPYGMFGINGDDDEIRSPYSLGPSYLVQRVGENAKAGERTVIVGSTFDFASLGAKGLSFDINYGWRRDRHMQLDSSKPLADWDELATDLVYVFPESAGWAKNLRIRARWAKVWENGPQYSNGQIVQIDQTTKDIRLDLQWLIPLK